MKKQLVAILVALSFLSGNVWALTLNEARTQGRVGDPAMKRACRPSKAYAMPVASGP